jgi:hypothetical protein
VLLLLRRWVPDTPPASACLVDHLVVCVGLGMRVWKRLRSWGKTIWAAPRTLFCKTLHARLNGVLTCTDKLAELPKHVHTQRSPYALQQQARPVQPSPKTARSSLNGVGFAATPARCRSLHTLSCTHATASQPHHMPQLHSPCQPAGSHARASSIRVFQRRTPPAFNISRR